MKKINSINSLDEFGRTQLSNNYFMRDFLYSEISNYYGIPNIPDDPSLAIEAGKKLCEEILEPLKQTFGHVVIRSSYRSCAVNKYGNENKLNCASNEKNYGHHIWDKRDKDGNMGATAFILIPWFYDNFNKQGDWVKLAWWIHDNLNYSSMCFFPQSFGFNIQWSEAPKKSIKSYIIPKGKLTDLSMSNNAGDHSDCYSDLLSALNSKS